MALVFDIETNGLWPDVDTVWLIMTHDTETKEEKQYSDYDPDLQSLEEGLEALSNAKILVGHNICGYDIPVLKELTGWEPNPNTTIYDTFIMSMLLRFKRGHPHGLDGWGKKLGFNKFNFDKFNEYSKEMLSYGIRDVQLNVKVYEKLVEEAKNTIKINPLFKTGLWVENMFSLLEAEIRMKGWVFNRDKAIKLLEEMKTRLEEIENILEPKIGMICMKVDKADEYKEPKWRKDGCYNINTAKWFGIDIEAGKEESPLVQGPYCRVTFEQGKISSDKVLKQWLYSIGWVPDEWNVERINGKFINKSPKLTESSLEPLGEDGKLISEYNSTSNRYGILRGWIESSERDHRLHGKMWTIGTPTFRCRHEVIANLPSVQHDKEGNILYGAEGGYGYEMRSLLEVEPGWAVIGADSAGNQMRGLCHYIGDDEFTNEVVNGDVHTRNAHTLAEFTDGPNRKKAKPFLYAFLFGAGAGKASLILTGKRDESLGKRAIAKFENSIPGLAKLKERLNKQYTKTKEMFGDENGFIRGIDGRIIFVSSRHQLLNYLLQTLEGITCKAAAVYLKQQLVELEIPHYFAMHYHDELAVCVPEEYAEQVKQMAVEAFTEAPKWFGVECMGGDGKIGKTYADVH